MKNIVTFLMIIIFFVFLTSCTSETTTPKTTVTITTLNPTTTQQITTQPNTTTTTTTTTTTQTTTTPTITTPITTTATSPSEQTNITLTKTATITSTTPTNSPDDQIRKAVTDLFVPEFKPKGDPIPILITFTNPIESQWSCNIPITFSNIDDEEQVVIWVISLTLNVDETREVLVEGISMGEGRWKVKVGIKTRIIFTS